jgi:uncharacterized membrane protein YraQ (UPF0718 family)
MTGLPHRRCNALRISSSVRPIMPDMPFPTEPTPLPQSPAQAAPPTHPAKPSTAIKPRKHLLERTFDRSFWLFAGMSVAFGVVCWLWAGTEVFKRGLHDDLGLMTAILPRIVLAMAVAGLMEAVLPKDKVAYWVGAESGMRGLFIATLAGALTPGGPITSFPFVVALYMAGADRGSLVAYLTAWSLLGFQRVMVWEMPLLGMDFVLVRSLANLPFPIIAGILARTLPGIEPRTRPPVPPDGTAAHPFGGAPTVEGRRDG